MQFVHAYNLNGQSFAVACTWATFCLHRWPDFSKPVTLLSCDFRWLHLVTNVGNKLFFCGKFTVFASVLQGWLHNHVIFGIHYQCNNSVSLNYKNMYLNNTTYTYILFCWPSCILFLKYRLNLPSARWVCLKSKNNFSCKRKEGKHNYNTLSKYGKCKSRLLFLQVHLKLQ